MNSAQAVMQLHISYHGSRHSGLEASYRQVDLPLDCVACIDKTTTWPVSPNRYYLYGLYVSLPLTWYQLEGVSAHPEVWSWQHKKLTPNENDNQVQWQQPQPSPNNKW